MSKVLPRSILPDAQFATAASEELASVLGRFGHEAGHYCVLGPDPWQVVWNEDHSGFVSFLEGEHCLLAWRSPVAAPDDQPELLARLLRHAEDLAKPLYAIEVNETTRRAGEDLHMTAIWTGSESFVDLSTWSLAGGRRQKLRWARSHALKIGVSWREAFPLASREDFDAIGCVERLWRNERPERRTDSFLRTDFRELANARRYFVAESPGTTLAFVAATPISGEGWYLQDVIRTPDAPRGALEGAIVLALDVLRDDGFRIVSNGPLPFWRPHENWSDPHQLGAIGNQVLRFFDAQYHFEGINQFRSKLEPDHLEPLYVIRSRRLITPRVARSLTRLLNKRLD